jgi:hypothetical protein
LLSDSDEVEEDVVEGDSRAIPSRQNAMVLGNEGDKAQIDQDAAEGLRELDLVTAKAAVEQVILTL